MVSMPLCRITISRYPQPPFASKYGIAITRLPAADQVKNIDTGDELSKVLLEIVGHTTEDVTEILAELKTQLRYGPYNRDIDENTLVRNGF